MRCARHRAAVAPLLVVLAAAACSGEGGLSSRERELADAFARDLADEDDGLGVGEEGGVCIGEAIMEELGSEPFDEAGVEPDDIGDEPPGQLLGAGTVSDEQADAIVAAWRDCVDLSAAFAEQGRDEFGLDDAGVACFEEALRGDDVLDRYLHVSFTSDRPEDAESALSGIVGLVQSCTAAEGSGGILVDSIAASLAADGQLTAEQAPCVAQQVVDIMGAERLLEITGVGEFETAAPEVQEEFAQAIIDATTACGIPPSQLGG